MAYSSLDHRVAFMTDSSLTIRDEDNPGSLPILLIKLFLHLVFSPERKSRTVMLIAKWHGLDVVEHLYNYYLQTRIALSIVSWYFRGVWWVEFWLTGRVLYVSQNG